nr:hypothetical protein [uncultured Albidiferax sp.]
MLLRLPSRRLWIALWVVACVLFAQLATAGYVCPQWLKPVVASSMPGCDGMPAEQMDPAQPNLCKATGEAPAQSSHQSSGVDLPPPVWATLWMLAWLLPLRALAVWAAPAANPARPPGSPPLYLFNQVFRL